MRNSFRKAQPLPPAWQPALGRSDDRAAFEAPESEPGFAEWLIGFFRGNVPIYVDAPPKVTWLPDPRAERNRAIAAERARRRAGSVSRGGSADSGPAVRFANDGPPSAPGMAPPAYSADAFTASQPDMGPKARAWISGTVQRQFGPTYQEPRPTEIISESAAREIEATAAGLMSSKWITIPPRAFRDQCGDR